MWFKEHFQQWLASKAVVWDKDVTKAKLVSLITTAEIAHKGCHVNELAVQAERIH